MPYIDVEMRPKLDPSIEIVVDLIMTKCPVTVGSIVVDDLPAEVRSAFISARLAGILNYVLSEIMLGVFMRVTEEQPKYPHFALFKGLLADVNDEFQRRAVVPYEDRKIAKNGDLPEYKALSKED